MKMYQIQKKLMVKTAISFPIDSNIITVREPMCLAH